LWLSRPYQSELIFMTSLPVKYWKSLGDIKLPDK
jgi:hypothetical protein